MMIKYNRHMKKSHALASEIGPLPLLNRDDLLGSTAQRYNERRQREETERNYALKEMYNYARWKEERRMRKNLTINRDLTEFKFLDTRWVV